MKAIRVEQFGGPEVLQLSEVETPPVGPNQVFIQVRAIGVNPVEAYIRSGNYGNMPQLPYTPGSDAAGEIIEIGEGVTGFQVGQRVYTWNPRGGAYAEQMLCDQQAVFALPDNVSFEQGAALGVPYATAHRALFGRGQAQPGESVLIHGASGGVGVACVQLARAFGLTVIGTAGTEEGRRLVNEQGAHHVLDHTADNYLTAIPEITGGHGVHLIIEMLANVNLQRDLEVLANYGRVVVVGNRGEITINPRETMKRDADIRGMTLFNVPPAEIPGIHAALRAGLEEGTLHPVIGRRFSLAEAALAHEEVMASGSWGKIILLP
ncbi:MAG TPA: NADPH:quinone reductase [Abditibacteriaceae bacterium]|jgi:NADPH2:quinone reductase